MSHRSRLILAALLFTSEIALAQGAAPKPPAPRAWVARSNENAKVLIQVLARFEPEDRKSTRLNSSHIQKSRMPSSA